MCRSLIHRGPDDEGYYFDQVAGLGNRRLSIIDLETGQQPICNEDESLWLVFNGEIYNYRELRARLIGKGHSFRTQSDSEVIVHAYEEYGETFIDTLIGMFAFAIWDIHARKLTLVRDRLGIKPLYYWNQGDELVFGSELKALLAHPGIPREIDPSSLDHYLTLEYLPSDRSILKDVHKLPAGHLLVFNQEGCVVRKYWDLAQNQIQDSEENIQGRLQELIATSVTSHLVSDVPVGAFLSGGIDSSTVVSFMREQLSGALHTFSIGFGDNTYNELPDAHIVARHFGTNHQVEILKPEIEPLAKQLIYHLDEPQADFSIFPTYLVSKLARSSVKVVLTGDGGDEVFGGYDTYLADRLEGIYRWLPRQVRKTWLPTLMARFPPQDAKKGLINRSKRFVEGAARDHKLQHIRWMMFLDNQSKLGLYGPAMGSEYKEERVENRIEGYFRGASKTDSLTRQQYVDIKTYLVDNILTKVDRMTMAVSLEARVPLLDHRLVEYAVNIPGHLKIDKGRTKIILRRIMAEKLPHRVLTKPKQGFSIPMKQWLRSPLLNLMRDTLSSDRFTQSGYFVPATVERWQKEHLAVRADHSHRLWALIVFALWWEQLPTYGKT